MVGNSLGLMHVKITEKFELLKFIHLYTELYTLKYSNKTYISNKHSN